MISNKSVRIFKALANQRRLEILRILLSKKKYNVLDISDKLELSFKSTSKHLQILENIDLVECKREGRSSFYSIRKNNSIIYKRIADFLADN